MPRGEGWRDRKPDRVWQRGDTLHSVAFTKEKKMPTSPRGTDRGTGAWWYWSHSWTCSTGIKLVSCHPVIPHPHPTSFRKKHRQIPALGTVGSWGRETCHEPQSKQSDPGTDKCTEDHKRGTLLQIWGRGEQQGDVPRKGRRVDRV